MAKGGMHDEGGRLWQGVRGRRDGHCSGRYASYWNAFLLRNKSGVRNLILCFYPDIRQLWLAPTSITSEIRFANFTLHLFFVEGN